MFLDPWICCTFAVSLQWLLFISTSNSCTHEFRFIASDFLQMIMVLSVGLHSVYVFDFILQCIDLFQYWELKISSLCATRFEVRRNSAVCSFYCMHCLWIAVNWRQFKFLEFNWGFRKWESRIQNCLGHALRDVCNSYWMDVVSNRSVLRYCFLEEMLEEQS